MERTAQDKVIVITGASGSIGAAVVEQMAREGWHVIMACRNMAKGEAIKQRIESRVANAQLEVRYVEMTSFASIRQFAQSFEGETIHALFNNAGIIARGHELTADGFESTMAVNYLAPALLTSLLLPHMAKGGHIVNMVSLTARFGRMNLQWQNRTEKDFSQLGTYSTSKQALLLYSVALARRCPDLHVNVSDPGVVDTNIISMGRWFDPLANIFFRPFIKRPEEGAVSAINALHADGAMAYYVGHKHHPIAKRYQQSPLTDNLWQELEEIFKEKA